MNRPSSRFSTLALVLPAVVLGCGDANLAAPSGDQQLTATAVTDLDVAPEPAAVFDLKADWSDTDNPNGVWSVNAGETPLVPVEDLSTTGIDVWPTPQPGFTAKPIFGDITPVWMKAAAPLANGDPDYEIGDIVTHTSRSFVPNSNVTWTSPISALIDISGSVWATREFGRTNDWLLYLNDALLSSGTVSSGDPYDREVPFLLQDGSGGADPLTSVAVTPGDVVRLEFEQQLGFGEDYVGVNLTISVIAPTSKEDCKDAGWEWYQFDNQGQCIRYVQTEQDSR